MVSTIEFVNLLYLLVIIPVIILIILYLFTWMHELGHLLSIVMLGYSPVAILCSKRGVALSIARESIKNRKHETIVAMGGFLGGLFVMMLFSLIVTFEFGFWDTGFQVLILGLISAVLSSIVDFRYLTLIRKYSVKEREKKHAKLAKKFRFPRWSMALILSGQRWPRWKKKYEKLSGEKISVREVVLFK